MSPDTYFWLIIIVLLTLDLRRRFKKISATSHGLRVVATPDVNQPKEGDQDANPECG